MNDNAPETLPRGDELYCFLDKERPCDAGCMAYMTIPSENTKLDGGQAHCVLIDSASKAGNGLHILAAVGGAMVRDQRIKDADAKRASGANKIPNPMGGG